MSPSIRPSIALAAFAEKFVEGRRVLVFGNALSPFWEQLIERGARLVHVCDSDSSRVAEAAARNTSQNVSFAPLSGTTLAVRDGAFDVGFVDHLPNLGDPAQVLHKLKRALGARGLAVVAAPNPDVEHSLLGDSLESAQPIDYYTLYDLVHREFPVVRMIGQMPFVGYSVAELAPAGEPEPSLDAGFVPGGTEEPEWFIAVGSQAEVELDPFVVVQLPHESLQKAGAERTLREQLRAARTAERSAVERMARLEAEQRRVAEIAERHQKDVDLARQLRLLQEELERKESWILQLEARASTADARADEADQELDELREQLESHRKSIVPSAPVTPVAPSGPSTAESAAKWEELETQRAELVAKLRDREAQKADLDARKTDAEARVRQLTSELAQSVAARAELEAQRADLEAQRADLEAQRADLEAQRADLEAQKTELEGRYRDVQAQCSALSERVTELAAQAGSTEPELEKELVHLEAQLVERGARVRQLENDLAKTERVGARLLRELERARELAHRATANVDVVAALPAPTEPAQVATVSTESWTQGPTLPEASTEQNLGQVSAWTEGVETTAAPPTQLQELRDKLDHLAAIAARQQADLTVNAWQLEQLQAENLELRADIAEGAGLVTELSDCRAKLQETEVLLAQIRWREATASDSGPVR